MRLIPKDINFNFVGLMKPLFVFSTLLIVASIILIFIKGLNYGIDFKGGIEIQVQFNDNISINEIRSALIKSKMKNVQVQSFGDKTQREFLLRLEGSAKNLKEISHDVRTALSENLKTKFNVRRTDMVGPKVGSELRRNGVWAIVFSLIFILLYIAFRFETKFAPGAVVALAHDVLITTGIFVFLNKEFNLSIIAALLTIVGYSLNDTIVVFDRIRENIKLRGDSNLKSVINISLNQTLSRTLLTSLTTLFVLVSLLLFGGPILHDFAFAMCLGVIVGTYSSIFIASPLILILDKYLRK